MNLFTAELRYAWRVLCRSPGFAAAALATLALGIGANAAIFSVVNGVLLRPLPYPGSDRIVALSVSKPDGDDRAFAPANYLDIEREARLFEAMAAYREAIFDLTSTGRDPQRLGGAFTTRQFFETLGAVPMLGRVYGSGDQPGAASLAVIAEGAWRRVFGGDPTVVGRSVRLSGKTYTVIGIAPSTVRWPDEVDVWVLADRGVPPPPLEVDGDYITQRGLSYFNVIARVRQEVSLTQAQSELTAISAQIAKADPENNRTRGIKLVPLQEQIVGGVRQALLVMLAAVGLVLLIAAGNVAHLLLARASVRARELAVRAAIGASSWQLVRQLLVEGLLLAFLGGALGLLVGHWSLRGLVALAPKDVPRLADVTLDWRVVAFTAGVALASAIVFAVAPAFQATRINLVDALRAGGRTGRSGGFQVLRRALVVAEVALASMLLVGAGLLLHSFWRLLNVDPGFQRDRIVAIELGIPESRYDTSKKQTQFYKALVDRLAETSGMHSVAAGFPRPFGGGTDSSAPFQIEGRPVTLRSDRSVALLGIATPGLFRTLGIPLLRGRDLTDDDRDGKEGVIVINDVMARRFWPGEDPIGKRIDLGGNDEWWRIVGIVGNHRSKSLALEPQPTVFLSYQQFALPFLTLYARTPLEAGAVAARTRTVLRGLDPDLPLEEVRDISAFVAESIAVPRFRTLLIGVFALLALMLATIGVYGVLTYSVTQRMREFGIRLALGATPMQVLGLTLREGLGMAALGLAIGMAGAWAIGRFVNSLLYEISPTDPVTFIVVPLTLGTIAIAACLRPAARAARVDPATSLQAE